MTCRVPRRCTPTSPCFRTPPRRPVGTHGLCVRCSTARRDIVVVLTGTDAQTERPYKKSSRCVRCSTARRDIVVVLTWTDALRLDTSDRPYSSRPGASVVSSRYSVVFLTGTDAQTERPYRESSRRVLSIRHRSSLILLPLW